MKALPTSPTDIQAELDRIRAEVKPTRRGIMLCAQMMADMLKLGWKKEDLDSLEILFWKCRDRHGDVRK